MMKKKEEVLKDFHDLCSGSMRCIDRRRCSGCRELPSLRSSQIFATPPPPTLAPEDLKTIHLKDVIQDLYRRARNSQKLLQDNKTLLARCYERRSLAGSLCVDAARRNHSALSVIEADDGTACILHVFHAVQSVARSEELRRLLPRGIRVVIARPSVGCLHPAVSPVVIYVESPASLDFVRGPPSPSPSPPKLLAMAPRDLRREGNALFAQGSYLLAVQCYTHCAEVGGSDSSEAVLAISNRAEAWLKLGMFDRAIADASAAIAMDPLHAKSFYRRGRALMAIQEHVEARASLKSAARHAGDSEARKEIVDELAKCKLFLQQSQRGVFDVGDYVSSGCSPDRAPRCSDFVGPIEVRLTRDGRGRGLFLTKKVRLGDLLLVANNVSFAVAKSSDDARADLVAGAIRAAAASRRILAQLYAIEDAAAIPSMKLFRPNLGHCGAATPWIDIARIQRAVAAGAFPWSILGQAGSSKSRVWALPAFINHSCLPNVSKLEVGKATMFHAARDLHAGDELLISYVDPFSRWSDDRRRALAESWGFECSCRRCCLERRHGELLRDVIPRDLAALDTIDKCTALLLAVEDRLARATGLSEGDKDLFRITLFDFYGPFSGGAKKVLESATRTGAATGTGGAMDALKAITVERLFRVLHATAPGHPKTLVYMSHLAGCRDSNSDVCHLLVDEFTAAYGSQCACLVWKVLQTYFEASVENLMTEDGGGAFEYRICRCWFNDDKGGGFRVECLL